MLCNRVLMAYFPFVGTGRCTELVCACYGGNHNLCVDLEGNENCISDALLEV